MSTESTAPKDALDAFYSWYDDATLDPPVGPYRVVLERLVKDETKPNDVIVDALCRKVPRCVKARKSRNEFSVATAKICSERMDLAKALWGEVLRRTTQAWSVPDEHIFLYLVMCDLYMIDIKSEFRQEAPLLIALERCSGKTRPSEGESKFKQVLVDSRSPWDKFESAALSTFPIAPRARAIHAMCTIAQSNGTAPGKFIAALTDAVFTTKGSLEEDTRKAMWAFTPLLKSLSADDVSTLVGGPVGRALRLTTEKSLPAAIAICEALDCNILPDDAFLVPALKALRTSSKENVQDMAAKLIAIALVRSTEASCGGVLKELCDELPREGSLYRRSRMIQAMDVATPIVSAPWAKMVVATLLKRARDEKSDETKTLCFKACTNWINPSLAGETLDKELEAILAAKTCYNVQGLTLIRLVATHMELSAPTKELLIKDLTHLLSTVDVEQRLKLYVNAALVALGHKLSIGKVDLTKLDFDNEQDCLAAVALASKISPSDGILPQNYYQGLALLLSTTKFPAIHIEAKRVCEVRVLTEAKEKEMMRMVALSNFKGQPNLNKFAIQSMLPPKAEQCDSEHLALALVLSFKCTPKDRRSTWSTLLKACFNMEARRDSFKFAAPLLFAEDREIDVDALCEIIHIDPQPSLLEPMLLARLNPDVISQVSTPENVAAFTAPPGRLSNLRWAQAQELLAGSDDDEDTTDEGKARMLRQGRKGRGGARREIYSAENEDWERKVRAEQKDKAKKQQTIATERELSPFEIQALKQEEELRAHVQAKVNVFNNAADALMSVARTSPPIAQALADKIIPVALQMSKSPLVGIRANGILDAYLSLVFSRDTRLTGEVKSQLRKRDRADPAVLLALNTVCQDSMEPLAKDLFELVFPIVLKFASHAASAAHESLEGEVFDVEERRDEITDAMFNLVSIHHDMITRPKREALLPGLLAVVAQTPLPSSIKCIMSLFSGDKPSEVEILLLVGDDGLLHQEPAVRLTALTALSRADTTPMLSAYFWFASCDINTKNRELAQSCIAGQKLSPKYYVVLSELLASKKDHVRIQAARAIAIGVDEHPGDAAAILDHVLVKYKTTLDDFKAASQVAKPQAQFFERGANSGGRGKSLETDPKWFLRSGVAFTLSAFAGQDVETPKSEEEGKEPVLAGPVFETTEALASIEFVLADGTRDPHPTVRAQMVSAGASLLQAYGKDLGERLITLVQAYLDPKQSASRGLTVDDLDRQKEGAVIFLGAAASNLSGEDERVPAIAAKLVQALDTPSEMVQRAACRILPQLMKSSRFKVENGGDGGRELVEMCVNKALSATSSFGARAGNAMGLAALIKGLGISALKAFSIIPRLTEASASDKWETRQGSLFCFDELTESLGRLFEPYVVQIVEPVLLKSFSDSQIDVREAAHDASKKVMANMSGPGVSMLLPKLLSGIASTEWRTKQASILMLGSVAFCAPKQLASALPQVVPKLIDAFTDTHPKVRASAMSALKDVQSVVKNPEIEKISVSLIGALTDPHERTKDAVDVLFQTRFVHTVDAPSLSLLIPILRRGLKERATETKKRAALIVGNMISMISDAKAVKPYLEDLMPVLKVVLVDPIPGVRGTAAKAMGTLVRGLGAEGIPEFGALFQFLIDTMLHGASSVERQGGAQGFVEVLVALEDEEALSTGLQKEIFDRAQNPASDPVEREGAMWGLVFLPAAMDDVSKYASEALTCALDNLADDNESVRDAALRCSRVYVGQFTITEPSVVLTALESGLVHINWRVRQTSVRLLGDFLIALQKNFYTGPGAGLPVIAAPPMPSADDDDDMEELSDENDESEDDNDYVEQSSSRAMDANSAGNAGAPGTFSDGPIDSVLLKLFGAERRDSLIATVYLMRSDSTAQVRQNTVYVWKTMVSNTPRMTKRIIKPLMRLIIALLSSTDNDRQRAGGRALGDIVKKLGDRVLPEILPVVLKGLESDSELERVGVSMGLAELVAATNKHHLEPHASAVLEATLIGLCDRSPRVRDLSGRTFNRVHVLLGAQPDGPATTYILTNLCTRLETDEESAMRGITQAVESRSRDCLTFLLPKLLAKPLKPRNVRALAECMGAVPAHLHHYLRQIVRVLVQELAANDLGPPNDIESELWLASEQCFSGTVTDEQAVSTLLVEITDTTANAADASSRRAAIAILTAFLSNSSEGTLSAELGAAVALKCTIRMFAEQDPAALTQAIAAFSALVKLIGAPEMAVHVDFIRNSVRTVASMDKHRPGMDKGLEYQLPAFASKTCVDSLLEVYQFALMNGSNEERESAAEGLGEFVDLTTSDTLKPYVVKITGPLIRIVGDRFPGPVKSAILETLRKLLTKGGAVLRPFLPQLQTTFVKALQNTTETVRICGFKAMQVLVPLSPRVDPLCSELVQGCTSPDGDIRQYMVKALLYVLTTRLADVSLAGLTKVLEVGSAVDACVSDWQATPVRVLAAAVEAKALEGLLALSESPERTALLSSVTQRLNSRLSASQDESKDMNLRHGALLALDAVLRLENGAAFLKSGGVNLMAALEHAGGDEDAQVRGVACDAAGWAALKKEIFDRQGAFAAMLQQAAKSDADSTVRSIAEYALRRSRDMFPGALDKMEGELA